MTAAERDERSRLRTPGADRAADVFVDEDQLAVGRPDDGQAPFEAFGPIDGASRR